MGRPKIDTPIAPQRKIKEVLARPNVQRNLFWLAIKDKSYAASPDR